MSLEPDVVERIQRDYPEEHWATVAAVLKTSGADFGGNRDGVQRAILKLADGDLDLVKHYAETSRSDFRDVIYWAFAWENDARRLLWELRAQLVNVGALSKEDDRLLGLSKEHGLHGQLDQLCQMLQRGGKAISAAQLETIKKLGQRFRLPARVWRSLATRPS